MKIGVVGIGKIGKFHIREFLNLNCKIVAVLDKNKEYGEKIAQELYKKYKIKVKSFSDKGEFFKEDLDVIDIATPAEFHSEYIKEALINKKNVFCEKPFIFDNPDNNYPYAKELIELAKKNKKRIVVNTQWTCIFDYFNLTSFKEFEMYMEPGVKGIDMLKEHLAHMNSILIRIIPNGNAKNIKFNEKNKELMIIEFEYENLNKNLKVKYKLRYKDASIREIKFIFDGKELTRKVDKNYSQKLTYLNKEIEIEDPFKTSIKKFLNKIKEPYKEDLSEKEILENIKLQDKIIKEYNDILSTLKCGVS
jgi:hypothetical protein